MLYSLRNTYPGELPNRIRLSDGMTRTDRDTFTAAELLDAGYTIVSDKPTVDEKLQVVEWSNSVGDWVVRDKTDVEIQRDLDNQWKLIRQDRNQRLTESDWTQMLDVLAYASFDFKDDWRVYRQALRDITNQSDPFSIEWPVVPTVTQ